MKNYPIHPLAKLFPPLDGEARRAFVQDVKRHGVNQPIILHEGMVLDGAQRYGACRETGAEPIFFPFDRLTEAVVKRGPEAFVISQNLHRRHLTTSQRAMIASEIATMKVGGDRKSDHSANLRNGPVSEAQAATMMKVSTRSVTAATKLKREAPEKAEAVKAGNVTLHEAVRNLPARRIIMSRTLPKTPPKDLSAGFKKKDFQKLIVKCEDNGGRIYVEVGDYGIQCRRLSCEPPGWAVKRLKQRETKKQNNQKEKQTK